MLEPRLSDSIFYVFRTFLVVNLAVAGALLVREVLLHRRWFRVVLIALSCFVFVLTLPQIATGYYFAFDDGKVAAWIAAVMAYVASMVLTVSGKRMASGLNRTVGVIGLGVPVLTAIVSPRSLFVGLILIFGFYNHNPSFRGRISPSLSYQVAIDRTMIGNGAYYRYTLFRNPQRLPLVRKQIANQPIYGCEVPAVEVSLKSDAQSRLVRVTCQQHASGPVFTGEIPLDHPIASVSLTATN